MGRRDGGNGVEVRVCDVFREQWKEGFAVFVVAGEDFDGDVATVGEVVLGVVVFVVELGDVAGLGSATAGQWRECSSGVLVLAAGSGG